LATIGLEVVSIDALASMLAICRAATEALTVRLVRADMAALPLRGGFGAVLCAFNTLFNLANEADQRQAVVDAARLLTPDGVLVVEAVTGEGLDDGPRSSVGVSRMTADEVVLSATVLDADAQVISGQHIELGPAGVRLRPWRLRWLTPDQLDGLAADAGLTRHERHGDWDESPFGPTSDRHVSVYRRVG
jgi:SAM-dependent methyltransferase